MGSPLRSDSSALRHHRLLLGASPSVAVHATTMDRTRLVIAAVAGLVGIVWALQGLGAPIGGSFMIGDPFWILAGLALVGASVVYAAWPRLRRR